MGAAERWPTFEIDVVARDVRRPVDAVLVWPDLLVMWIPAGILLTLVGIALYGRTLP